MKLPLTWSRSLVAPKVATKGGHPHNRAFFAKYFYYWSVIGSECPPPKTRNNCHKKGGLVRFRKAPPPLPWGPCTHTFGGDGGVRDGEVGGEGVQRGGDSGGGGPDHHRGEDQPEGRGGERLPKAPHRHRGV